MQSFMIKLLICSATMSVLILFYMAITPLLAKRYSVTGRYYTWLVIVAGLVIPFRPQFNRASINLGKLGSTALPVIQKGNGIPISGTADYMFPSAIASVSWWQIAVAVWLAGVALFLLYHISKHYRFMKLAVRWSEDITDEQIIKLFRNLKMQMGITQKIGLRFCSIAGGPMMIGFIKPCILLPQKTFSKQELCFVLKHELVHYKRKDLWYKLFVLISTAIHWFNPTVYLMAKAIGVQCELSCDKEVIRSTDADTRRFYGETIISIVRHHSKLKTALSTNFYGGKRGMKERLLAITDMSKKKAGFIVVCFGLIFTLGTGFAFPANAETQAESIKEDIKEDIAHTSDISVAYKFLPDPEIYSKYAPYGLVISDDGEGLLYNGQQVRLFIDEHSDVQAFFMDEAGSLDLRVIRSLGGGITGIENIPQDKAQEYRSAFFADEKNAMINAYDTVNVQDAVNTSDTTDKTKYEQYAAYGITLSSDGNVLDYNGQRVKLLVDMVSDDFFETYWFDEAGTINLSVVRNSTGNITSIERISEEQAQKYHSKVDKYEKEILSGLDDKIAEKMKERYPES